MISRGRGIYPFYRSVANPIFGYHFSTFSDDVVSSALNFTSERLCPVFLVSNVTGANLDLLSAFLNLLSIPAPVTAPQSIIETDADDTSGTTFRLDRPASFQIDELFTVPGVGAIVSGTCLSGVIRVNDTLSLGPDTSGRYFPVLIKSIQRKRLTVNSVRAGQTASFALKRPKVCTQLRRVSYCCGNWTNATTYVAKVEHFKIGIPPLPSRGWFY